MRSRYAPLYSVHIMWLLPCISSIWRDTLASLDLAVVLFSLGWLVALRASRTWQEIDSSSAAMLPLLPLPLRLARILHTLEILPAFREINVSVRLILPAVLRLLAVLFAALFAFAVIATDLLGDVNCHNTALAAEPWFRYCKQLSFNGPAASLFTLLIVRARCYAVVRPSFSHARHWLRSD